MDSLRTYLIAVSCAAVLYSLCNRLSHGGEGTKILAGLILTLVVLRPLTDLTGLSWEFSLDDLSQEAQLAVAEGEETSRQAMIQIIKEQLSAYILEQADGAALQVTVEVSEDAVPVSVSIRGTVSPYTKLRLQTLIEQQLGIAKENQQWT